MRLITKVEFAHNFSTNMNIYSTMLRSYYSRFDVRLTFSSFGSSTDYLSAVGTVGIFLLVAICIII